MSFSIINLLTSIHLGVIAWKYFLSSLHKYEYSIYLGGIHILYNIIIINMHIWYFVFYTTSMYISINCKIEKETNKFSYIKQNKVYIFILIIYWFYLITWVCIYVYVCVCVIKMCMCNPICYKIIYFVLTYLNAHKYSTLLFVSFANFFFLPHVCTFSV